MQFIDAVNIAEKTDLSGLMDAMYQGHLLPRASAERLVMSAPDTNTDAQLLVSPAWQDQAALGVKLASIFPQNAERQLPREHGLYLLFDPHTGQPQAVLDAVALTPLKTAADSALAARLLANSDVEQLLLVGSGPVARALLQAHLLANPSIGRVKVWSRQLRQAQLLVTDLQAQLGVDIQAVTDLADTVSQSQIICCATPATAPLIHGEWLQPGCHVDLVGSYTLQMREADSDVMRRGRIFVDSRELTIKHCGDLAEPIREGVISATDIIGDLFQLCQARENGSAIGRLTTEDITVYKNAGGPHLDLMAARYIASCMG